MSNKSGEIKIVAAAETSSSLLDNPDVLDVLANTTNEARPEEKKEDSIQVGRLDAATTTKEKKAKGRPKGSTKPKSTEDKNVKCNFAVVLPVEKAKALHALIAKLDSVGMGKVNANIALNNAVDLLLAKHKDK